MLTEDNYLKCSYKESFRKAATCCWKGFFSFFWQRTAELRWEVKGAVFVFVLVLNWTCWWRKMMRNEHDIRNLWFEFWFQPFEGSRVSPPVKIIKTRSGENENLWMPLKSLALQWRQTVFFFLFWNPRQKVKNVDVSVSSFQFRSSEKNMKNHDH